MYTLNNPYKKRAYSHFRDNHVISGQDYDIMDLLRRFSRGERLNVNQRPMNILEPGDHDETFDNILPQVDDITELEELHNDLEDQKKWLQERREDERKRKTKKAPKPTSEE